MKFKEINEVSLERVYENMYNEIISEMTLDMCIYHEKFNVLIDQKFEKYDSQLKEAMKGKDPDYIDQVASNSLIKFEEGIYARFEKEMGIEIPRGGI